MATWMKNKGYTPADAYGYFVQRVGDMVRSHGRDVVNWVEVYERLGSKLDNRTIVHVWKSKTELSKASACMQIGCCV